MAHRQPDDDAARDRLPVGVRRLIYGLVAFACFIAAGRGWINGAQADELECLATLATALVAQLVALIHARPVSQSSSSS